MVKTAVKSGQSWSAISKLKKVPEEDLKRSNPGVQTLKTGQVINVPNVFSGNASGVGVRRVVPKLPTIDTPFGSFGQPQAQTTPQVSIPSSHALNVNNPSGANFAAAALNSPNNTSAFAGSSIGSGSGYSQPAFNPRTGARDPQPKPPLNGQQSQGTPSTLHGQQSTLPPLNGQQSVAGQPYTGTAGYYANYNQQNSPYLGASSYLNPRFVQAQTQTQIPKAALPARPTTQYTGDPNDPNTQLWNNYWNQAATLAAQDPAAYQQAMGTSNAPTVMTREEIRRMKEEQRRRQAAQAAGDEVSYSSGGFSGEYSNDPNAPFSYPELRRSLVWSS